MTTAFAHDVGRELRDPDGKWTGHGGVAGHDLAELVKGRHPDVEMSLSQSGKNLRISLIRTPESQRGQGKAGAAMRDLAAEADKRGVRLTLSPEPLHGDRRTNKAKLTAWYKSLGFVENKGRNKDYEVSDAMYREPRGAGLNASATAGLLAYGLRPAPLGMSASLLATGAYTSMSWELQMEAAHAGCHISAFCRNPLHPGPCKGWKHHLGLVSPGALHALEKVRHEQLEKKRQSKVQALKDAGKAIPKSLQTPIVYDPAKNKYLQQPDKITPGLGIPTKGLTPEAAKATLEKIPTKVQVGEKLDAKHAAEAAAKPKLNAAAIAAANKLAFSYTTPMDKRIAVYNELTQEDFASLDSHVQEEIRKQLKSWYQYNPEMRKDIAGIMSKFSPDDASWAKAAAHPGYTPGMAKVGKLALVGPKTSATLTAPPSERLAAYEALTPEEFGNLHPQEKAFVNAELDSFAKGKAGTSLKAKAAAVKQKLSTPAANDGGATNGVAKHAAEAAAAAPKLGDHPALLTLDEAGLKDGDKVMFHGHGDSGGGKPNAGKLAVVEQTSHGSKYYKLRDPKTHAMLGMVTADGSKMWLAKAPEEGTAAHAAPHAGPIYMTVSKAGLKDGDKVFLHGKGKSAGEAQLVTVRKSVGGGGGMKAGKSVSYKFEDAQGNELPQMGGASSKWLLSPAPGKSFPGAGTPAAHKTTTGQVSEVLAAKGADQVAAKELIDKLTAGSALTDAKKAANAKKIMENAQASEPKKLYTELSAQSLASKIVNDQLAIHTQAHEHVSPDDVHEALVKEIAHVGEHGGPTPVLKAIDEAVAAGPNAGPGPGEKLAAAVGEALGKSVGPAKLSGFDKGEKTKLDALNFPPAVQEKHAAQATAIGKFFNQALGKTHDADKQDYFEKQAKVHEEAGQQLISDAQVDAGTKKIAAKLWQTKPEIQNKMHQGDLEKALAKDVHEGINEGKPTPVLDAAKEAGVTLGQDKPGAVQTLADAVHAKLGVSGKDDTPTPGPGAEPDILQQLIDGVPEAGGHAPHVKEAIDYANGFKAANDTKKLEAYQKLSPDELAALDPNTQKLMAANLTGMTSKFLNPAKQMAASTVLKKLQVAQGGGAGAGGSSVHTPTVGALDPTADVAHQLSYHAAGQAPYAGGKAAPIFAAQHQSAIDTLGKDAHFAELGKSFATSKAANVIKKLGLGGDEGSKLQAKLHGVLLQHLASDYEKALHANNPAPGGMAGTIDKLAEDVNAKGDALAINNGWPMDSVAVKQWKSAYFASKVQELAAATPQAGAGGTSTHVSPSVPIPSGPGAVGAPTISHGSNYTAPVVDDTATTKNAKGVIELKHAKALKVVSLMKSFPEGQYLESPEPKIWDNLVAISAHEGVTPMQALTTLDTQNAKKLGLENKQLLEAKIRAWLATPDGKDYAAANGTPKTHLLDHIKSKEAGADFENKTGIDLPPGEKVQKLGGPGEFEENAPAGKFGKHDVATSAADQNKLKSDLGVKFSKAQLGALTEYVNGSGSINGWLRDEFKPSQTSIDNAIHLQSMMLPQPRDHYLLRGTGWTQFPPEARSYEGLQALIGETLEEPAFLSASVSAKSTGFGGAVKMHIEAPKGTMAVFTKDDQYKSQFINEGGGHEGEAEMLLAAKTELKVLKVWKEGGQVQVLMRVVS